MGIDASTNSIAFAVLEGEKFLYCGELTLVGSTIYERIVDARRKTEVILRHFDINFIAIEKAVMVRSAEVGLKLAMVFGTIISVVADKGATVVEVFPIQWQSYIGNKNLTLKEKAAIKADYPGKSATWYKAKSREIRKQRTMDFFNDKYGLGITSDNVSDAMGIAWYAAKELTR